MGIRKKVTIHEAIRGAVLKVFEEKGGSFYAEELQGIAEKALEEAGLKPTNALQSAKQTISDMRKEGFVIAFDKETYAYLLLRTKDE